jgi:hypothetical protein
MARAFSERLGACAFKCIFWSILCIWGFIGGGWVPLSLKFFEGDPVERGWDRFREKEELIFIHRTE